MTVCFDKILPKFAYPGKSRVGKRISDIEYDKAVTVSKMDYNNPMTWVKSFNDIKKFRPDVIILQWWSASVVHMHLLVKLFSQIVGSKLVIEFHEVVDPYENSILPLRIYARESGKLLRSHVFKCITHSESDKLLVADRYKISQDKISVVPLGLFNHGNAVNKQFAKDMLGIKEKYVILAFGLIRRYKGIKYLIKAYESLPESLISRSRLLIVGEVWEDKEELIKQINESDAASHITLVDEYIPDYEVSRYFSAADVITLPYTRSSQSAVAATAMVYKKPVIASKVGGLIESLHDYLGTIFVQACDVEGLRNALLKECTGEFEPPKRMFCDISNEYLKVLA